MPQSKPDVTRSMPLGRKKSLDKFRLFNVHCKGLYCAGMLELVDRLDSESSEYSCS